MHLCGGPSRPFWGSGARSPPSSLPNMVHLHCKLPCTVLAVSQRPLTLILLQKFGNSQRGGQNVSCDFGGGGKRTIKHPLQNQFWRPQKVGFVWSVLVSSKENDIA